MDELDLRTLWQEQPLDDAPPASREGRAVLDFAVPTSQFPLAPRRQLAPLTLLALAAFLALGVMLAAALKFAGPPPVKSGPPPRVSTPVDQLLAECRTYSISEPGLTDWPRAKAACQKAIELDPIHAEANQLLSRIAVLEVCEQNYEGARQLLAAGQLEGALTRFEKVGKGCESYLLRSRSLVKTAAGEVEKVAGADCQAYASNGKWDLALPRCELYARIACQRWDAEELSPPALMKLKLEGPLDPRTEWRPKDQVYLRFLQARQKIQPAAKPWVCPRLVALLAPPAPPDPSRVAVDELSRRYPDPELNRALVLYFRGDLHSAPVLLQKVGERMSKAQYHQVAHELLLDMHSAINLYENGASELTRDRPEKAAAVFLKALAADERLVLGERLGTLTPAERKKELGKRTSFVRRSIIESMSVQTYEKGKALADRKDFRAACRVWKVGLSFSRSNIDLLKAVTNVCTSRAAEAFERAKTCEQHRAALDFAVDGDGFREKIEASLEAASCK